MLRLGRVPTEALNKPHAYLIFLPPYHMARMARLIELEDKVKGSWDRAANPHSPTIAMGRPSSDLLRRRPPYGLQSGTEYRTSLRPRAQMQVGNLRAEPYLQRQERRALTPLLCSAKIRGERVCVRGPVTPQATRK